MNNLARWWDELTEKLEKTSQYQREKKRFERRLKWWRFWHRKKERGN